MAAKQKDFLDDRISNLPDAILCHILSFLPTKYSVRTSILSTIWKQLFTFVPNLYLKYKAHSKDSGSPASSATSFVNFVNCLFILYNVARMSKFRLRFTAGRESPEHFPVVSWISNIINRNVEKLDIVVSLRVPRTLPRELFSCKTLKEVNLEGEFNVVLPSFMSLPCLKTCHLENVCLLDNESATRLFKSCPALEILSLTRCSVGEGVEVVDISSPLLKRLHLGETNFPFLLNLPSLLRFGYYGPAANKFLGLESLKSLLDFAIDYNPLPDTSDGVVVELIYMICHVRKLYLNIDLMEVFVHSEFSLPIFKNLTRLELGLISSLTSRLLSDLLDKSPRLESIEFTQGEWDEEHRDDDDDYSLPEHVPACVALHIKEVEFEFAGSGYECKMIRYFLKHAKNLKVMKIRNGPGWNEQCEISSAACQIVLEP